MEQISEEVEKYKKHGLNPLTRDIQTIKAWDLVLVHLLLLRDLKKYGPEIISHQTEKKLDEILTQIFSGFYFKELSDPEKKKELKAGLKSSIDIQEHVFYSKIFKCLDDYKQAKDTKDKAAVLSKVLNIWHLGGSNIVLRETLTGVPYNFKNGVSIAAQDKEFLSRLNNLGRDLK